MQQKSHYILIAYIVTLYIGSLSKLRFCKHGRQIIRLSRGDWGLVFVSVCVQHI